MNTLELAQGSQEWLDWRRTRRMASETPAVTRRSPYQSWEGLRDTKRGGSTFTTAAMAHGHKYESTARFMAQAETGMFFKPVVVEDDAGVYGASLDGLDGSAILEIKCPASGRASKTWKMAEAGLIRPDYDDQIIHQMAVANASICYFAVYDADTDRLLMLERRPDADVWKGQQKLWEEFWTWHLTDDPDPAKNVRSDEAWADAAAFFTAAKRQADYFSKLAEGYRANLLELAGGEQSMGAGVRVTPFNKVGSIDYKKAITDLAPNADLETYRKKGTTETRVTVE